MGVMHIDSRHEYPAPPDEIFAMMTDPDWLIMVVERVGAQSHHVTTTGDLIGVHAEVPAPDQVKAFTGATLAIDQQYTWARVEQGYDAHLAVTVERMPGGLDGQGSLRPTQLGTLVHYVGEVAVKVPLVGGRLEKAAAPHISRILQVQFDAGEEWLARH